ncbi:MAG: hypothetical protein Q4E22_02225 [Coriobacteriia bacterium]|nr:hypothetical protein [Coriobacteriia bacterium]
MTSTLATIAVALLLVCALIVAIKYVAKHGACAGCEKSKTECKACSVQRFSNYEKALQELAHEHDLKK